MLVLKSGRLEPRITLKSLITRLAEVFSGPATEVHTVSPENLTEAEVAETLGVCIQMMGGPGTVYAPRAFAAFREFAETYASRA